MPDDSAKVNKLAVAAEKLASSDPKEAVRLTRYMVELSKKIRYKLGEAMGYNEMGHAYERYSVNDSAFYYFFIGKNIFSQLKNPGGKANVLFNIGNLHEILGGFDSAAIYLFQSLQLSDSINDTNLKGKNHRILGKMLIKQNRLEEGLEYYFSALRLLKIQQNLPEMIARVQEDIALVYTKKEDFTNAELFFQNALNIYVVNRESRGLARVNLNMAALRMAQGKYKEGLSNCFYPLNFYKKIEHLNGIAESLMQLSEIYLKMKKYNTAIDYALNTLKIVQYNIDKDIELAAFRVLQKAYFEKEDSQKAYYYLSKASALSDSIFSDKKESIIRELQAKYETDKKENEIMLLNKDKQLNATKTHRQETLRNAIVGGTILILIIGLLFFNRYQISQKNKHQKERLRISNDLHDEIGSTLSSISMSSSYAAQQLAENKAGEAKNILEEISTSSQEMIDDINDIIWAINPRYDNFTNIVNRLKNYSSRIAQSKYILLQFESDDALNGINLSTEHRKNIYLIIKEAMNNAIKYSGCKNLLVKLERNKNLLIVEVTDNGNGFDANKSYQGNGLKNMQARALQIKADLSVQSSPGSGTKISFEYKLF